ncbi:MAG: leucine-rich repeat domain-containing protein [Eubacteriales bacterium]|nr:leucine-rich repeat domain-containing protein [Eubacteriales bacterium]
MKRIFKLFMFAVLYTILNVVCVFADNTADTQDEPRTVCEKNGTVYTPVHDQEGNWCYSVQRMEYWGDWLDSYEVRTEIDGIPVKIVENMEAIGKLILHNNIEYIDHMAFAETGLMEINIPDSVRFIGKEPFVRSHLKKVTIGNGMPILKGNIFSMCSYLEEVIIKEGVKEIREWVFSYDNNIKRITIPASVTYIEGNSFNLTLKGVKIYGYKNSYAEHWAKARGYQFEPIGTVEDKSNDIPVMTTPQINGNQMSVSIKEPLTGLWDGYCYEVSKIYKHLDEDYNMIDTSFSRKYCIYTNKAQPAVFRYLPSGSYYIQCRGYRRTESGKEYGAWSIPALAKITSKISTVPKFVKAKVTKGTGNTRNLTITLNNSKKGSYDCVLGKTKTSIELYEKALWNTPYKSIVEKKPADYAYVKKNLTKSTVTFKNVKPGTYYFGAHAFQRYGGKKNFGQWSTPIKVVVK